MLNWSPWSVAYTDNSQSVIASPAARYIRVSAILNSDATGQVTPILNGITIDYPEVVPTDPTISSTTHPTGVWSRESTAVLRWSQPQPNPAPESSYQYWLLDGTGVTVTSGTYAVSTSEIGQTHSKSLTLGAQGLYTFVLQGVGDAFSGGNTSTAMTYSFKTDYTPPSATGISSPTHPQMQLTNNNCPVFKLLATDSLSGVSGYAVTMDRLSGGDPGNSITHWSGEARYSGMANGTYYLHARAIDAAGNTGAVSDYGFRVDFNGALLSESSVKALPNPIRGNTARIEYELAAGATDVTLEFLSGAGESLLNVGGNGNVGKNYYLWDLSRVANGVYFCRIKAKSAEDGKSYSVTKKIAVIK